MEHHLKTSGGQRLLLTPPQSLGFGVEVDRQVMRLGFLEAAELEREVSPPAMYEEEEEEQAPGQKGETHLDRRVIHEEFRMSLTNPTCLVKGSVKIERVDIFDEHLSIDEAEGDDQLPTLSVSYFNRSKGEEDWEDLFERALPMEVDHNTIRFSLDCFVPGSYRGSILRWVIFHVSAKMVSSVPTQEVLSKFSFGLSFNCTIVDDAKPLRALNSESKSFLPQYVKAYFDHIGTPLHLPDQALMLAQSKARRVAETAATRRVSSLLPPTFVSNMTSILTAVAAPEGIAAVTSELITAYNAVLTRSGQVDLSQMLSILKTTSAHLLTSLRGMYNGGGGASGTSQPAEKKDGRKRKPKQDPNKPKRPPSAYNLFYQEKAPLFKQENPELKPKDIIYIIGPRWKECTADEKAVFEERAKELEAEFEVKMAAYLSSENAVTSDLEAPEGVAAGQEEDGGSGDGAEALRLCRLWVHMLLEEVQMSADIREWDSVATQLAVPDAPDAHCWLPVPVPVPVRAPMPVSMGMGMNPPGLAPGPSLQLQQLQQQQHVSLELVVSFTLRGSSENRPEIRVGNKVYMKISHGSCVLLADKHWQVHGGHRVAPECYQQYVLEAEVCSFALKNERVTCVVSLNCEPSHLYGACAPLLSLYLPYRHTDLHALRTQGPATDSTAASASAPVRAAVLEAWRALLRDNQWHLRFGFSPTGLSFARLACLRYAHASLGGAGGLMWLPPRPPPLCPAAIGAAGAGAAGAAGAGAGSYAALLAAISARRAAQLEGLNEEQALAVLSVVSMGQQQRVSRDSTGSGSGSAGGDGAGSDLPPFICYGPPGTGKTRTVVHTIEALVAEHRDGFARPAKLSVAEQRTLTRAGYPQGYPQGHPKGYPQGHGKGAGGGGGDGDGDGSDGRGRHGLDLSRVLTILVTAPSDAAADVLAIRLTQSPTLAGAAGAGAGAEAEAEGAERDRDRDRDRADVRVVRLNWWQRPLSSVPIALRAVCFEGDGGGALALPPSLASLLGPASTATADTDSAAASSERERERDEKGRVVVVVTTCGTAGAIPILLAPTSPSTTSSSSSSLLPHQTATGLFDFVFVDEASQATEAETLVPLCLCKRAGYSVLAGDPHQLGASVRSPLFHMDAGAGGRGRGSLLSRLLTEPCYRFFEHPGALPRDSTAAAAGSAGSAGDGAQELLMGVFLRRNYRSHKDILALPSALFYDGQLQEMASPLDTAFLLGCWAYPSNPTGSGTGSGSGGPRVIESSTVFAGVLGQHMHEQGSPSFYNVTEVEEVVKVVRALVGTGGGTGGTGGTGAGGTGAGDTSAPAPAPSTGSQRLSTRDIGVICAFRAQVLLARQYLREAGLGAVNVGSVEDFQGQEMTVCIVSTVLSSVLRDGNGNGNGSGSAAAAAAGGGGDGDGDGDNDSVTDTATSGDSARAPGRGEKLAAQAMSQGLVGDPRKFNVAVTRGRALVCVVGHPGFLCTDAHWAAYIAACHAKGSCFGTPVTSYLPSSHREQEQGTDSEPTAGAGAGAGAGLALGRAAGAPFLSQAASMMSDSGDYGGSNSMSFGLDLEWRSMI